MITKIVSGGQTGADRGGLEAARLLGIDTGGFAPRDFMTEDGPDPSLRDFGLVEANGTGGYFARTRMNVLNSDGTLVIGNMHSTGSSMTIKLCNKHKKPCLNVWWPLGPPRGSGIQLRPTKEAVDHSPGNSYRFTQWVRRHNIYILNVAGNRESIAPGIREVTMNFLQLGIESLRELEREEKEEGDG